MLAGNARKTALLLSGALALAYLIAAPQTLDLAAQTFRADLFSENGVVIWNPDWYGGHSIPGYSLLVPPLAALLGPVLLGALSAVAATALFSAIAWRAYGQRAWLGVIWFAVASLAAPFAGRTTFAVGLAIGLGCVWAIGAARPLLAAVLAALTAWASPVAGLFVLVACSAVVLAALAARAPRPVRIVLGEDPEAPVQAAIVAAAGAAAALAVLGIAFPTDGRQPFATSTWIGVPLAVVALLALVPVRRGEPGATAVIRWGAVVYLIVATAAFVLDTALGSNAARLGATVAGPILAILLVRPEPPFRPRLVLALLALPLLWWCWIATVRDVVAVSGEPSVERAYYEPLLGLLEDQERKQGGKLEPLRVVPSRNRWEAVYVAEERPITGGWLRQLEAPDFAFLRQPEIEPDAYRAWLAARGIGLVAISSAEPDRLGGAENALLDSGALDADLVGRAGEWRLYRFEDPGSFVLEGDARLLSLEPDRFEVALGAGPALVGLGHSPYFEVVAGNACVERAWGPSGRDMTRIVPGEGAPGEQRVVVEARFSLAGALGRDRECAGQPDGG